MPSPVHEALIELFRVRPQLVAELLTSVVGMRLPEFDQARVDSADLPEVNPTEYRADAVVTLTTEAVPVLGVIVEIQLRPDSDKCWSWPVYLATLRARLRCLVLLVVLCPTEGTADRCRQPITVSPGFVLTPVVVSPKDIPVITDPEAVVSDPGMAALSAIAHRSKPERDRILTALAEGTASRSADPDARNIYLDLVMATLPKAAQHFLEALMRSTARREPMSDFFRGIYREGEAKGEAGALMTVLSARGFDVSAEVEARIRECTDPSQLNKWVERAVTAASLDDLFTE